MDDYRPDVGQDFVLNAKRPQEANPHLVISRLAKSNGIGYQLPIYFAHGMRKIILEAAGV